VPFSPPPTDRIVGVAVPVPGLGLLSYRAPGQGPLHKGARVRVPLGTREVVGCIVHPLAVDVTGANLRDIVEVVDAEPFVPPHVVDLALWVGDYYASGPGAALALAMPVGARRGAKESFRKTKVVELATGVAPTDVRGTKQRVAIERLADAPQGVPWSAWEKSIM
jgi:primosomal protein N' (replication factor Y)